MSDNFKITNITKDKLPEVAQLHTAAFPDSLLTLFGEIAILKYYEWQMEPPNRCFAIGAFEEDRLLGFSFSGILNNAELFFIKKHLIFFTWYSFKHPKLLLDKRIINQIRKSVSYVKEYIKKKQPIKVNDRMLKDKSFGILSTAVAPEYQGHGIGRLLTENVEKFARENNYPTIRMSVEQNNIPSVKLHEKLGYKKVLSDEGIWQGIMIKKLDK